MQAEISRMIHDYDRGHLSRRALITHLTGVAAALAVAPRVARAAAGGESTFKGTDLNHIALRVTDIGRSREF